jgi:PncC family amidohydrolase
MGGDPLVELATRLQAACIGAGRTVALAESCTGGIVAAAMTAIPGSSRYFVGGVVSYADAAKRDLLDVDPAILEAHGAVSAHVARAMALGARSRLAADVAAAVTGIAGPDGGSAAKPVGLTYVSVADAEGVDVRRVVWTGDREANRRDSALLVLEMLLARVESPVGAAPTSRSGSDAG